MIQPLLRNILVELIPEEKTIAGILLPDKSLRKEEGIGYYKGKVLGVGQGIRNTDGSISPLLVKEGDIILFWKYNPIKIDGKDYLITYEEHIIAILKNGK